MEIPIWNFHPAGEPETSICRVIKGLQYEEYGGALECLAYESLRLVK